VRAPLSRVLLCHPSAFVTDELGIGIPELQQRTTAVEFISLTSIRHSATLMGWDDR
jgi:hypothetical protein